jgi:hypothetical protein
MIVESQYGQQVEPGSEGYLEPAPIRSGHGKFVRCGDKNPRTFGMTKAPFSVSRSAVP